MKANLLSNSLLVGGLIAGCSDAQLASPGSLGAPCPNDNNCLRPLVCVGGICSDPGVQPDAGDAPDAGPMTPDTGPVDAGPPAYMDAVSAGPAQVTADGMMLGFMVGGRAAMVREASGYTDVMVRVSGLTPGTTFSTHVHAKACTDEQGGPHYKIDENVVDPVRENEIWPDVVADALGDGVGRVRVSHYARVDAQSVIIHEPAEARRIVCFDLQPNAEVQATGTFAELPAGAGMNIVGSATLVRRPSGTTATVMVTGTFQPDATYPAHIHARACDDEQGGPHYKIDTAVMDALEENEIWPSATASPDGTSAMGSVTVSHIARFDAVSVVLHDPVSGDRLACATFTF